MDADQRALAIVIRLELALVALQEAARRAPLAPVPVDLVAHLDNLSTFALHRSQIGTAPRIG
jgi:hypothetical protein